MMKSRTSSDLRKMDTLKGATPPYDPQPTASGIAPTNEWLKNPINAGSIYIKESNEQRTYTECIFQYCWWYWCCGSCK
jgi:hypothetical protein